LINRAALLTGLNHRSFCAADGSPKGVGKNSISGRQKCYGDSQMMSRIVQRVLRGYFLPIQSILFSRGRMFPELKQRCGSLGAVLGYDSVFSPFTIEVFRSDALN